MKHYRQATEKSAEKYFERASRNDEATTVKKPVAEHAGTKKSFWKK